MVLSNQQLRDAFLSPQMECYFEKKLPDVPAAEVGIRIEEALKFLNIATYCHGNIPVSKEIDEIWHLWILETREYAKLCSQLQGRQYLHHSSNVFAACADGDEPVPQNDLDEEVSMLATYVLNYGPFEEERIQYWPFAAHLVASGLTVDQLNDWLEPGVAVESGPTR